MRIHLDRHAKLGPPGIGLGDKGVAVVHRRVEQRHRQPGLEQKVLQVRLRRRPDSVSDIRQGLAEQGRPDVRPGGELGVEVPRSAAAPLHRVSHNRPHVAQAGHTAHGIGDSAGRRGSAQRAACQVRSGSRVVRYRRTNPASRRFLAAGTRTSMKSADGPRIWWQRSAAGPVITLPLPACSVAAISAGVSSACPSGRYRCRAAARATALRHGGDA